MDRTRSAAIIRKRRIGRSAAVGAVLAVTLISGCAQVASVVPQTIVWVPGSYTFSTPPGSFFGPSGDIIVCSSTGAVLYFQSSIWTFVSLKWTAFSGGDSHGVWVGDVPPISPTLVRTRLTPK